MKKWLHDETVQKNIFTITISGILLILFFTLVKEFDGAYAFVRRLVSILSPFIWGLVFAFFLIPLANKIETFFPLRSKPKLRRLIVSILCVVIMILLICAFFAVIIPQIIISIGQLTNVVQENYGDFSLWVTKLFEDFELSKEMFEYINSSFSSFISNAIVWLQEYLPGILQSTISTFTMIGNFVIGMIVALYILIDRDHLKRQITKLSMALLSDKHHQRLGMVVTLSIEKFSRFFIGKVLDSIIIGILTFIAMTIFKLDYTILISFIVGLTNIIPFFGPFIGAIPSILILLIINPLQALIFAGIILVIQQLDGNIIGPMILGDSMGLSSLWIMFAIMVGGAYFGILGMVAGVPIFAIIYYLVREFVNNRLKDKGIHYEEDENL